VVGQAVDKHGLEASEVIGFVLALMGIAALWKH
jgi:hypothetical protein